MAAARPLADPGPEGPARAEVWKPEVTVATVVERDGRFLFVEERVRGELVLNQPAGHLDPGESLIEAALRETLEESAWEVEVTGLVAIYHRVRALDGETVLRFTFAARPIAERVDATLDAGIERVLWLAPGEIDRHTLRTSLVRASLDDYAKRTPLPLDAISGLLTMAERTAKAR